MPPAFQETRANPDEPEIPTAGIDALQVLRRLGPGDVAVAAIAGRQHGAIATAQLHAVSLSPSAIYTRVRRGGLHPWHRGVYLVGHIARTERTEMIAATLAVGDALLSNRSACRLYGYVEALGSTIHVSTPARHRMNRDGIAVHRIHPAHATNLRVIDGIPVVSPVVALLGLAGTEDERVVQRALNEARVKRAVRDEEFESLRELVPGAHGWGSLGRLLASERGPDFSRKEAELRLWRLIRTADLPIPRRNATVQGKEVDFWWPDAGLVVEVDGWAYHSSRAAFERDRAKWADLQARGLMVLVFTWRQIVSRRPWVVARIAAGLRRGA